MEECECVIIDIGSFLLGVIVADLTIIVGVVAYVILEEILGE